MQELKLADDLFPLLFEGRKTATVRKGRRDFLKGSLALEATSGGWGVIVNVKDVRHVKLKEITDADAQRDGLDSLSELTDVLRRFYPDVAPDSDMTIVEFEFKDPLVIPEFVYDESVQDVTGQ